MQVHKFGGSLLKDAAAIQEIGRQILALPRPSIVVLSALKGVTTRLEQVYQLRQQSLAQARSALQQLWDAHLQIAQQLEIVSAFRARTDSLWQQAFQALENRPPHLYSTLVHLGERSSVALMYEWLRQRDEQVAYVSALQYMVTDAREPAAEPISSSIAQRLNALRAQFGPITLTEGYIAATPEGQPTTLGREGSDLTATLLAGLLQAKQVTLWKAVPGIYNADPSWFADAQLFEYLNVYEAIEMTFFGSRVLHPRTYAPLEGQQISLWVRSPETPHLGTQIGQETTKPQLPVAIVLHPVMLITAYTPRATLMDSHDYARVYQYSHTYAIPIRLLQKGARSLSLVVPQNHPMLSAFVESLRQTYQIRYNRDLTLLTLRHAACPIVSSWRKQALLIEQTRHVQHYLLPDWHPTTLTDLFRP